MRRKDAARLSALRMLKAAFMNREVEKGRALDDTELRQVVQSLVKQRRDSIEQFSKGGRQDLVDKETAEQFAEMVYGVKFDFVSGSPVSSAKTRSDGELIEKPVIRASRLGVELSLVERSS